MRKNMNKSSQYEVCVRIAQVRLEVAGPRGKSVFAKKLGLSPSTYDYYESNRVPPAEVLIRIAQVADVDLNWLLTGQSAGPSVPVDHPVLQRACALLAERPNAAAPLSAFLQLLAGTLNFPAKVTKQPAADGGDAEGTGAVEVEADSQEAPAAREYAPATTPAASWIPILGRSAAGVPHFWGDQDESAGLTSLAELIARHAHNARRQVREATAATEDDQATVQVISCNEPDSQNVVSFVSATGIKGQYPDAFALQIDGDSMTPDISHGDLVVLSPSVEATDGRAAVVQLAGQIGVTCKLFRREGDTVHLVPINEQLSPQSFAADQLVWALRVLARVRA